MADTPFIKAEQNVAELTFRVVVLAIVLTVLLAMSNAYLALKLGILTSASIPAAIISMGILRFFKNSTILENNAVQTAASAGEAVAGGIVYTIPALIIIGFWNEFDYLTNFFIAACGGVLGVLFSIPLRRLLVNDHSLKFPEGRAIAEVLKSSSDKIGIKDIFIGGAIGSVIELLQLGFKVIASSWSYWFVVKRSLFGIGAGFSATMIGAGYLVGHDMAISIFLGAVISWLIALPIVSQFYPQFVTNHTAEHASSLLWSSEMRYLGIGAMLFAGMWTFLKLIRPLSASISTSLRSFNSKRKLALEVPRTDKDVPMPFILMGIGLMAAILFLFFQSIFPLSQVGLDNEYAPTIVFVGVLYVLFVGFLFSVITAYFSGMVGVTASPGSSIVISGMLFAAWLLLTITNHLLPLPLSVQQMHAAEAITIVIGSVVTGIAAIANDNTQDLKVGQLVGATPWKQQVMLLLGVLVSALVIPPVMQLMFMGLLE
jgi:putative OPT family oligopeptide transporter